MSDRISFKFRTHESVTKAAESASRLTTRQQTLAAQAVEKMGGRAKFDALVAEAAKKGTNKAFETVNKLGIPQPTPQWNAWDQQLRDASQAVSGTPNGGVTDKLNSIMGAQPRDDRTNAETRRNTNQRIAVAPATAAAAAQLSAQKATRPPTPAEIQANSGQKYPVGEHAIVGAIRAARLIREGKL